MFFFYFQARSDPENAPVVLWMTGGPGCSSELAVFFENGPWTINPDDLSLTETKHGYVRTVATDFNGPSFLPLTVSSLCLQLGHKPSHDLRRPANQVSAHPHQGGAEEGGWQDAHS